MTFTCNYFFIQADPEFGAEIIFTESEEGDLNDPSKKYLMIQKHPKETPSGRDEYVLKTKNSEFYFSRNNKLSIDLNKETVSLFIPGYFPEITHRFSEEEYAKFKKVIKSYFKWVVYFTEK